MLFPRKMIPLLPRRKEGKCCVKEVVPPTFTKYFRHVLNPMNVEFKWIVLVRQHKKRKKHH